jgi:protein TonB
LGAGAGKGSGGAGPGDRPHATRIHRADPFYSRTLQKAGIGGEVEVSLRISATGQLVSVSVAKSSGHPELDQAAIGAARASTYEPKRIGGVAMADSVTTTYRFVPRR